MSSLYRSGWRQGSIFTANLVCLFIGEDHAPQIETFDEWLVVTQECDLDGADVAASEPLIELRPIYPNPGSYAVGIRSEVFVLDATRVVRAQSPRLMIAPSALSGLCDVPHERLSERRAQLLKLWLGLRYDRPAVPDEYVALARAVAAAVKRHKAEVAEFVLDILMRLDPGPPIGVGLYAVANDETRRDHVEDWLQEVAADIPAAVGVVRETQFATVHTVSLWTLQNTYSADVSQLSITKADKREI